MQSSEGIISVCFNSSLLKYGGDIAVGAMTILTSVMMFAMLPLQGLGQGAQPIISYNYGASNPDRVKKAFWLLLKVSMAYATLLWLFIMVFPKDLPVCSPPMPLFLTLPNGRSGFTWPASSCSEFRFPARWPSTPSAMPKSPSWWQL